MNSNEAHDESMRLARESTKSIDTSSFQRDLYKKNLDLTVVVPCLNESESVREILDSIFSVFSSSSWTYEVIVIDDSSDDDTYQEALSWFKEHRISPNGLPQQGYVLKRDLRRRGYGAAVRYGVAHGLGEFCIFVSADGVDPIGQIDHMLEIAKLNGSSIVQLTRYVNKKDSATIPFNYKFFQFFFRAFVRIIFGKSVTDSTYAFKIFRRAEALALGMTQNRFSLSPELTFKALLAGRRVDFVQGSQGVRTKGESKFHFMKEGPGFIYCLIRAALHKARVIYWF
jgi:glycosyltransferase involved in cell wall biosynthesis